MYVFAKTSIKSKVKNRNNMKVKNGNRNIEIELPIIPSLRMLRKEKIHKFKVILSCIIKSYLKQ